MNCSRSNRFTCPGTISLLVTLVILAGLDHPARAGVAMSPLKQEISLKPGDETNLKVTLANNSHIENGPKESVSIEVKDVDIAQSGTIAFVSPGSKANSASAWINLSKTDLELDAGKSLPLEFTIKVPQYAQPGEYYAALLVTLNHKGKTEKGVIVQYRIASGIFVTVLGRTLPLQAKIARCELLWREQIAPTTQPTTQPAEPEIPKIDVVLQNVGAARFDGSGTLVILDNKLRPAFRAPLTSKRPCIFASDSRIFEAALTRPLPAGKYLLNVEMDYQSTWAKAHSQLPVEITAAQAAQMSETSKRKRDNTPVLEANVEKLTPAIYTGGTRSIAVAIINTTEEALHCTTSMVPAVSDTDGWLVAATVMEPGEFALPRGGRRSVELRIHVPPNIKDGIYSASIVVETALAGADYRRLIVPLEVEVRSQK